jgi:hypothetical protein
MLGARGCDREVAMNPLYHQLLGVIGVILTLGALGIFRALRERLEREQTSLSAAVDRLTGEDPLRLAAEISRLRPGSEAEDPAQHKVGHK